MNKRDAQVFVSSLASQFPKGAPLDDDAKQQWVRDLAGVDLPIAREAADRLHQTSTFFPAWSEFIQECGRVRIAHQQAGDLRPPPERFTRTPDDGWVREYVCLHCWDTGFERILVKIHATDVEHVATRTCTCCEYGRKLRENHEQQAKRDVGEGRVYHRVLVDFVRPMAWEE